MNSRNAAHPRRPIDRVGAAWIFLRAQSGNRLQRHRCLSDSSPFHDAAPPDVPARRLRSRGRYPLDATGDRRDVIQSP